MKKYNTGLTALEILIVFSVLSILFVVTIGPFRSFRDTEALNSNSLQIVSILNDARNASIASKESSPYGVHFESDRIVYFKGTSFTEPSSYNKELKIETIVKIYSINFQGGGSDVVFDQITGETQKYGTVTLQASGNPSRQKIINISQTGIATIN